MSSLIWLVIVYAILGLAFTIALFILAGRLNSTAAATGNALTIKVAQYEVSTGSAIVALAILSCVVMLAVPAYFLYLSFHLDDHVMTLMVKLDPNPAGAVSVVHDDGSSQTPALHVYRSRDKQTFILTDTGTTKDSIPITVWYDWSQQRPVVSIRNGNDQPVRDFNGESGSLGPIQFGKTTVQPQVLGSKSATRTTAAVPASLHQIADPDSISQMQTSATPNGGTP
jgi:hypothetical protein